jgi:hypothetical protein
MRTVIMADRNPTIELQCAVIEPAARGAGRRFNHVVQRGRLLRTCRETDDRSGVLQDAARFRKTFSLARSTKARKLAAMWRRPG